MGKPKKKENRKKKVKNQRTFSSSASQNKAAFHTGTSSSNVNRKLPDDKKPGFYRTKSKINLLNLYRTKIDIKKRKAKPLAPARIHPDRRWFGNTRVISQDKLNVFRENIANSVNDSFSVLVKQSKLPLSLFSEKNEKKSRINLLQLESFEETFGSQKTRKKPKLHAENLQEILCNAIADQSNYEEANDCSKHREDCGIKSCPTEEIFRRGTSKRIWNELYKVIDSSDVIVEVIDCRDPIGTRCIKLEKHIKNDRPNKHMIILLNKCDLVPSFVAARWRGVLSKEFPTIAFHASLNKPFGKSALMHILRQYSKLLKDRKHVSVGFVGYPNVGKSSVINTLRRKKVCKSAPIPGETKVWQYVNLTSRLYLIDCPGVVPDDNNDTTNDDSARLLKGAIRAERVESPEIYIDEVLRRIKTEEIMKRYNLADESDLRDSETFLSKLATKMGKLLKGGEPDMSTAARIVLYDWQRGRLPYYVLPPAIDTQNEETAKNNESKVKLNQSIEDDTVSHKSF